MRCNVFFSLQYLCRKLIPLSTVFLLSACGGGGSSDEQPAPVAEGDVSTMIGGGELDDDEPAPVVSDSITGDPDATELELNVPDNEESELNGEAQAPQISDTGGDGLADTETPETPETSENSGNVQGSMLENGATVQLVAAAGMPAVGVADGVINGVGFRRFSNKGSMAFVSRVTTPEVEAINAKQHVLSGPLTQPSVVLAPETEIRKLRTGYELDTIRSLDVAANADVATIASMYNFETQGLGTFGGSRTVALIRANSVGAEVLVHVDDNLQSLGGEQQVLTLERASISDEGVAFIAGLRGPGARKALFIEADDGIKAIVEDLSGEQSDAPVIDGCEVILGGLPDQIEMLDSGALIFTGLLNRENINSPCERDYSAIFKYEDGNISVLAQENQPVPGAPTFVFEDVNLLRVLADGRIVVASTLVDRVGATVTTEVIQRESIWVFSDSAEPVPVYIEGESFERLDGTVILDMGNVDAGVSNMFDITAGVNASGAAFVRLYERQFSPVSERLNVYAGMVPSSQPHASLETPGASNLVMRDEQYINTEQTGTPLTLTDSTSSVLADTDRLLRVGDVAIDSTGNIYFHARVFDKESLAQTGDFILKRDGNGELSVVVSPLDRIEINGRNTLILSGLMNSSFGLGLGAESIKTGLTVIADDSLVISRFEDGAVVVVRFP